MKDKQRMVRPSWSVAALLAVFALPGAQDAAAEELVVATFGGGVEEVWENSFAKPFTEETGIEVRIVPVPSPEAQVRAQAGQPQYDVALVTYPQGANLHRDGLVEPVPLSAVPAAQQTNPEYLMHADDEHLVGVSPYFLYYAIAFNNTLASAEDFRSWQDLTDPKWKGRLTITRPIYMATYDLPIMAKAAGGDEEDIEPGLELLRGVLPNVLASYTSIAHMNQLLSRGEIAAGPYYSGRVWHLRTQGATQVEMTIPEEGALMIPYIVVVPKGTDTFDSAMKFLDYISQAEPQQRATQGGYLPLNSTAVLPAEIAEEMGVTLETLMPQLYQPDWALIANTSEERINMMEKLLANSQ